MESGLKEACVEGCPIDAMFSGTAKSVITKVKKRAARYTKIHNEEYIVYEAGSVNSFVGTLGWITITPKKVGVLAVGAVVGTADHFMYWLVKRKKMFPKLQNTLDFLCNMIISKIKI